MRYHPAQRNIVWTVLFSLFTILSLNACGDANNVTGPPPPIPLSPDAKLSSLTVNTGPLDPVFSGDILNYAVNVATSVGSITVTARPQNTNASMTINGQATPSGQARTITLGRAGLNTLIPIVVTAVSGSQNTYIVTVNRAAPGGDNNLAALSVTGQTLTPAFSASQQDYTVNVATSVGSVAVTARKSDPNAVMSGSVTAAGGQATGQATIPLGGAPSSTIVSIIVAAPNGNRNTYNVTVNRAAPGGDNNLAALSVTGQTLTPAFSASQLGYTVNVATSVGSVAVTARKSDPNAVMSGSITAGVGQATGQATIPLGGAPSSTIVSIIVAAPNGSRNTYNVTVNRAAPGGDNNLAALSVTGQTLTPAFSASQQDYTVNVATSVGSVAVTARKSDPNAVMSGSVTAGVGQATGQATIPLGGTPSSTIVSIIVTAPNGSRNTYIVTVNRAAQGGNNNLQNLTVEPGSLAPTFTPGERRYRVNVADTVGSVTVTAQPQDAGATININDQPTTTGLAVTLGPAGTNTQIDVDVMAPNGSQRTYTVVVSRAAFIPSGNNNLSALAVSAGALNEPFDAVTLNYTVTAPASTTADTTVTATVADSTATLTINNSPATSGVPSVSIPLAPGATTSIPIVVTAENRNPKTYTVNITMP